MYYEHFGLTQPPFKITPNTDFFFSGGKRGAILEALIYAVVHGEGIVKVSGEVGSGKTMLCRMLQERLPPHVETVYLANPNVSPDEILYAIAFELQLKLPHNANRLQVMQALHHHLLEHHMQGKQVVVFVEESQGMPLATLEELRLLSNLETNHHKLLQIVLFGQPELDENLREPNIRQLRERITHSFHLGPLTAPAIEEYLSFRLRAAGYHGPDLFNRRVAAYISKASGGLTRRVNIIADKTLLAAYADNTHTIKLKHVKTALKDCEFGPPPLLVPRWAAAALAMAAGITLGFGWNYFSPSATDNFEAQVLPVLSPPIVLAPPSAPAAAQPTLQPQKPTPLPYPEVDAAGQPLLQQRIQAAKELLEREPQEKISIELFLTDDVRPARMEGFLRRAEKAVILGNVYVFPVTIDGRTRFRVMYGIYDSREDARAVIELMPEKYKAQFGFKLHALNEVRHTS